MNGETPEREALIAAAAEIHDGRCGCDRKYRMSCPVMANAVLEAGKRLREAAATPEQAATEYQKHLDQVFAPVDGEVKRLRADLDKARADTASGHAPGGDFPGWDGSTGVSSTTPVWNAQPAPEPPMLTLYREALERLADEDTPVLGEGLGGGAQEELHVRASFAAHALGRDTCDCTECRVSLGLDEEA